jgi:hypothetical protein
VKVIDYAGVHGGDGGGCEAEQHSWQRLAHIKSEPPAPGVSGSPMLSHTNFWL